MPPTFRVMSSPTTNYPARFCRPGLFWTTLPALCGLTVFAGADPLPLAQPAILPALVEAPAALLTEKDKAFRPDTGKGYLGVTLTEICPEVRAHTTLKEGEGLMIGRVAPDSPAADFGLRHYDILTKFNDQWIMSPAQFIALIENAGPGSELELTVLRRGAMTQVKVILSNPPPSRPSGNLAPLPEEMLTSVIRLLRDNPVELETVHRLLHSARGGISGLESPLKAGSRVTLHNDDGEVEVTSLEGRHQIRAWDAAGQLVFEGPCNSPGEHDAIPESLRPRVERLLQECRQHGERRTPPPAMAPASTQ